MTLQATGSFKKTLTAAKASSFAVVDEIGFGLTEANLNSIESHIDAQDTRITEMETAATTAGTAATTAAAAIEQLTTDLAASKKANAELTATVAAQAGKLVAMGTRPAKTTADPASTEDPLIQGNDANEFLTSADVEKKKLTALLG